MAGTHLQTRAKRAFSVPLFGPDTGCLHPRFRAVVFEAFTHLVGVESRQVTPGDRSYQDRRDHGMFTDRSWIGLVAGVGAGVRPAPVPGTPGVGVRAVELEHGDARPEERPVVAVGVGPVPDRDVVVDVAGDAFDEVGHRFGGVSQCVQVAVAPDPVEIDERVDRIEVETVRESAAPDEPGLLTADARHSDPAVQVHRVENRERADERRDTTAVVECPLADVVGVEVGTDDDLRVGVGADRPDDVATGSGFGTCVDPEVSAGALGGVLAEPVAGLPADADAGERGFGVERERPGRGQLAGDVVDEDERLGARGGGAADLLDAVVRPVEVRRCGRLGENDRAADLGLVEFLGCRVADVDQRRVDLDGGGVRECHRLEGPLDVPVGDADGECGLAAGPACGVEALSVDVRHATVGERLGDEVCRPPVAGAAAESVVDLGQAGEQRPGAVVEPGASERRCRRVVESESGVRARVQARVRAGRVRIRVRVRVVHGGDTASSDKSPFSRRRRFRSRDDPEQSTPATSPAVETLRVVGPKRGAMSSVPDRSDIDEQYKWDLEALYADDDAWEAAFEDVSERIDDLAAFEGRATEDAGTLLETLSTYEDVMRQVANVSAYARMRRDENTADGHYQALATRAQSLHSEAASAASFIEPAIQDAGRETVDSYVEDDPDLETYEHYFDDVLRMQPHTRSTEVETLLADLGEVLGSTGEVYNMLANADFEFPAVDDPEGEPRQITLNNFTTLQENPDRAFRREVYEAFYDHWEEYRNSVAAAYRNSVKTDVKLARARNYDTAREAALDGPNVPVEVYDTLVDTVNDELDVLGRHADLKRRHVGADELRMWDLYVPMVEGESPDVEYEQAREWVTEAVAPLGEEYQDRLAAGLDSRWVDVYETENKQSGAYSGGTYDSQPYILMNYQDDAASMYTLAHELGHSLHSEFTSDTQPYVYSDYEIFVAEVASTVNETLLTHHLLDVVQDERLRRHVLNQYLERFRSTLFRQTMFAEFEHRTHELAEEGEALTADRLDDLYRELKDTYYADADVDDRIAREWMRIPHFYRAFYVYQYATGISAAVALAGNILEEGQPAAERYLDFLSSGSRKYPLELLDDAGVDMTSSRPVESAIDTYDEFLDEFEQLL